VLGELFADEETRPGEPVHGEHAVTGTLPTLQDVVDFKEGTGAYRYGYYRFVEHPYLRVLKRKLTGQFPFRNCLLYCSQETALIEICGYIMQGSSECNIRTLNPDQIFTSDHFSKFFPPFTPCAVTEINGETGFRNGDILLFSLPEPSHSTHAAATLVNRAKTAGCSTLCYSAGTTDLTGIPEDQIDYLILPLAGDDRYISGSAVLSNNDRHMTALRERHKRRGPLLSSREAVHFLGISKVEKPKDTIPRIKTRLSRMEEGERCFLFPSGMNAIATLLDLLRTPDQSQVISIGHLYTDTYTMLRDAPCQGKDTGNVFLNVAEVEKLPDLLNEHTAAIITETITNPLNDVPDLEYLGEIADKHNIPFIVDNTFATPQNCKPFRFGADYVVHSTTKYLNGANNHGGGALLCRDRGSAEQIEYYQSQWNNRMSVPEADILWQNMQDFTERMERFNRNASRVAEFLENQLTVERVYFCGLPTHRSHETASKILDGFGSVISFTLADDSEKGLKSFYDSHMQAIKKAPTLGSNQTLVCPYTMIAHYFEPEEWLESLGLSRYLVRIAVGCEEDIRPVIADLATALENVSRTA